MCVITQEFISRLVYPKTPSHSYTDFKERTDTFFFWSFSVTTQCRATRKRLTPGPLSQQKYPGCWESAFQLRLCSLSALGQIGKVSQLRCLWSTVWLQGPQRGPGLICLGRGMRPVVHIMRKKKKVAGSPCGSNTKAIYLGMRLDFSWPSWSLPFPFKIKKKIIFQRGKVGKGGIN